MDNEELCGGQDGLVQHACREFPSDELDGIAHRNDTDQLDAFREHKSANPGVRF